MSERPSSPRDERRKASEPNRPYHIAIAVGVTTGIYAVSLLVTTRSQIDTDRALIEDRAPMQTAIDELVSHHDWLETQLTNARSHYTERLDGYNGLTTRVANLDKRLASMDRTVQAIERLNATLAGQLAMPGIPSGGSRGSSSGGGSSGSKGGSGGSTKANPPSLSKPAAPPPVSATTGASGAP